MQCIVPATKVVPLVEAIRTELRVLHVNAADGRFDTYLIDRRPDERE